MEQYRKQAEELLETAGAQVTVLVYSTHRRMPGRGGQARRFVPLRFWDLDSATLGAVMSAHNGDKSRFHRLRKAKIARRQSMRARVAAQTQKPAK